MCLLFTLKTSSLPCCRVEPAQLRSALQALARLAADPQLLVDFFVNYDCDLQVPAGPVLWLLNPVATSVTCRS
jgi:Guanine nucleotide exchange factor in Golgi transport N-terminal